MILNEKTYAITAEALSNLIEVEAKFSAANLSAEHGAPSKNFEPGIVAVINISGALFPRDNIFTWLGFGVSLSSIQELLVKAANSPQIERIVLNFDSPGGSVTGINELANYIKSIDKPVTAYVSGLAASAAYWLAAACDTIVVDATAVLGSIGVVGIYRRDNGANIEIVSANAANKRPDPATDAGRMVIQQSINYLESVFIGALGELRPTLSASSILGLKGDIVIGNQAVQSGLADSLGSLQAVINGGAGGYTSSQQQASAADTKNGWARAFAKANGRTLASSKPAEAMTEEAAGWAKAFNAVRITPLSATQEAAQEATSQKNEDDGWAQAFAKINRI
ncbi:MAG: S49 family peptidase [Methylobacter sp.]|nr:S49 family peptidase [Methylobacter sp.]